MTTKRLGLLLAVLAGGLGLVVFLPRVQHSQPAGIELALPEAVGGWRGTDAAVSENEKEQLGPETEFARKLYRNAGGEEIFVSVVLAGRDMNTSIHRPERCLPSQGWTILASSTMPLDLDGRTLKMTRLLNTREVQLPKGGVASIRCLDYYWFVGSQETTSSHARRMFIDMRDRLLKGYNQRWAYITVLSPVTSAFQKNGLSEKETDDLMAAFIKELVPRVQKPNLSFG